MGKIFCLMGKSSSGKDTIFKEINEDKDLDLKPIISYTTRPKRINETNGVEYFFINKDDLNKFEKENKVIEKRVYHTVHGDWFYGTINDGQIDLSKNNYLLITTLEAYESLRDYFGDDKVCPFYIDIEDGIRLERALEREKRQDKPNYDELCRRFLADNQDFSDENLSNLGINKFYINENLESCINNIKKDIKSGRWQKVVALILLASVVFTIGGSIIYNELNRPTEITQDEIYTLIVESELIEQKAIEEVKKTIDYEQNYVGGTYVIDIRTEKEGVILVDLGQEVNYPAAYVQLYGTATLKYKRGWYIEDIVYRENYGLEPLFTAGESFLNGLSTDIYGKGYFEYNGVKYAFAPSYVDSLCTMTEEGNFEATKVGIAPYNKDGRIDIYATMKYNFDIWAWELIDFETSGTR